MISRCRCSWLSALDSELGCARVSMLLSTSQRSPHRITAKSEGREAWLYILFSTGKIFVFFPFLDQAPEPSRRLTFQTVSDWELVPVFSVCLSVCLVFTVPPRAHPSTGSQSGSATPDQHKYRVLAREFPVYSLLC